MDSINNEEIRQKVRERYAGVAEGCSCSQEAGRHSSCCGNPQQTLEVYSTGLGYSKDELSAAPDGANMGLGCGNPTAIASLKRGETVVDLGSGGGFDCFLAAGAVGETGRVIGVDMTPEMVGKARENAKKAGAKNVEFRLGEIEHLPVEDGCADVIISNCVINLSPEKGKVFREAYRVLKGGGRLAVSDIVATSSLPEEVQKNLSLVSACIGGAEKVETIRNMLEQAGFEDVRISLVEGSKDFIQEWLPGKGIENAVASARIEAKKPVPKVQEVSAGESRGHKMESKEIRKKVYANYQAGFHCAEAISKTVLEIFSGSGQREIIKTASAFGGGIAGSTEELCGAFTGGVIALGYLLGREKPGEDLRDCGALVKEFQSRFKDRFGSLNCKAILDSFAEAENPLGCVKLTAEACVILADLLDEFEEKGDIKVAAYPSHQRGKVELGRCPFAAGS
jgi:C_GCAxxG_C_C family probable redox protein